MADSMAPIGKMAHHKKGWAVYIQGDSIDLDDLRRSLIPPFDPWVEDVSQEDAEAGLVLRSSTWDALTVACEVNAQAGRMIDILNGAKPLQDRDSKPFIMGGLIRFDETGKRHYMLIAGAGHFKLEGCRLRAFGVVGDGPPAPPQESELQRWIKSAETDEHRAELFVHLGRLDNWFDIYKAAELLKKIVGGKHALERILTATDEWNVMEKVWLTANYNRHAPGLSNRLPDPPAELDEARQHLLRVTPRFL
jgi:hypothetical protein